MTLLLIFSLLGEFVILKRKTAVQSISFCFDGNLALYNISILNNANSLPLLKA